MRTKSTNMPVTEQQRQTILNTAQAQANALHGMYRDTLSAFLATPGTVPVPRAARDVLAWSTQAMARHRFTRHGDLFHHQLAITTARRNRIDCRHARIDPVHRRKNEIYGNYDFPISFSLSEFVVCDQRSAAPRDHKNRINVTKINRAIKARRN